MREEAIGIKNLDKIIPVGQKVIVYISEGNFKGTYSSYIYDLDDKYIYILMPTNENGLKAVIREGEKINISFVSKNGYRVGFDIPVTEIIQEGSKVIYKLAKPEKAVKIELRENFRVEILIDVEFYYFKEGKIGKSQGTIIDISAGGIKLSCDDDLEIRDKLFLTFKLGEYLLDGVEAEVVRKVITGEEGVKHYGLKFSNISKDKEDKIIKFCINKQIEMARKLKGMD